MTNGPATRRLTRVAREVAIWVGIVVVTLALLEGAASMLLLASEVRALVPPKQLARPRTVYDTLLGWRNAPHVADTSAYGRGIAVTTDELGLRTWHPADSLPVGGAGLVCSGDSFTFGLGVSGAQTWCARLQRELPGLRTAIMAQEQYGLDQSYLWYRRDGPRVPHRVQLLAVTWASLERAVSGDDGGRLEPHFELEDGHLVLHGVPVAAPSWAPLRRARLARLLGELRIVEAIRRTDRFDPGERKDARVAASRGMLDTLVGELAALHRARGTRLAIVILPSQRDIRPGKRDDVRRWLGEAAEHRGIPFLDLTPALRRQRADSIDLAFIWATSPLVSPAGAGQYSPIGHAWVAGELARWLAAEPWLELKVDERLRVALRAPEQQ